MLSVRFEHTIPEFERAKTVHVLDPAATAIATLITYKTVYTANHYFSGEKIKEKRFHDKIEYVI
jgi:hypothetical protein